MKLLKIALRSAATALLAGACTLAHAIPTLQLGILGGTYNNTTQTVVANSSAFSLHAYLNPNTTSTVSNVYWLTMALTPQVSVGTNLGSFSVNGTTYQVTNDMIYGTPPDPGTDKGDMAPHSIYPTYFQVLGFVFNSANQTGPINTQDSPGIGPVSGTGMYYNVFNVNTANLAPGYSIHFDLFQAKNCTSVGGKCSGPTDVDIAEFAPFSHDAESQHGSVPEPGMLWLLGAGLVGLGFVRRRKQS